MIIKKEDMKIQSRPRLRDGNGTSRFSAHSSGKPQARKVQAVFHDDT